MAEASRQHDLVFYDGYCAMCHGGVKRVMRHDAGGERFRFAPLQGSTIREALDDAAIAALPDSVVVVTPGGEVLTRSRAVTRIVDRLGRPAGLFLLTLPLRLPRPVADGLYRVMAKVRYRLFGKADEACPVVPAELRPRLLP